MRGKRILAFACSMLMIGNQFPVSLVTSYAEENDLIKITLSEDFQSQIILNDKVYDGSTNIEADFSKVELIGLEDGDDLSITAKAEFTDANAGENKVVKISDLTLEGVAVDSYSLEIDDSDKNFELTASIEPAVVYIIPSGTFIEGEKLPKEIDYVLDENCIINNDRVEKNAKLIVNSDGGNGYIYQIDNPSATGNDNYVFELKSDDAPMPEKPESAQIIEAKVESADGSTVQQYDFGIVSNGSVKIVITAEEEHKVPVEFILSDGQSVTVEEQDIETKNGKFYAKAEFTISLDEGEKSKNVNLTCSLNNGSETQATPLQFFLNSPDKKTQTLVIDSKLPVARSLNIQNYIDGRESFDATAKFADADSGIKSIKFCWDADLDYGRFSNKWNEDLWLSAIDDSINEADKTKINEFLSKFESFDGFAHNPNAEVDFYSQVKWNKSIDTRNVRGGAHKFYYAIIDNAGNITYGESITNGSDTVAPIVSYIRLKKNTASAWNKILKYLSFGTYVNTDLTLEMQVIDKSESNSISEVKSVELVDVTENNGQLTEKSVLATLKANGDGIYTYKLSPNLIIENFYVKVTDNGFNTEYYSIKQLLQSDVAKEIVEAVDPDDPDAVQPTTEEQMDWDKLMSDKWVFDNEKPSIGFEYQDEIFQNGVHYFNLANGILRIKVSDNGSLSSIEISENSKKDETDTGTDKTIVSEKFNSEKKEYSYEIDTTKLSTGWYIYTVSTVDCAGNSDTKQTKIFVDHNNPDGSISITSPETTEIESEITEYWVREKDENGKYLPIIIRLDAIPHGAPLHTIEVDVTGENGSNKHFEYSSAPNSSNKIYVDEDENYYVIAEISADPNSSNYLKYDNENLYKVQARITAESGNFGTADFTIHVDTENPEVKTFSVKKNAAKTILNVLTFGVFANDSIEMIVDVIDAEHDIGIDYVEMSYIDSSNKTVTEKMNLGADGKYHASLDFDTKIFQSEIVVTVYDRIGKYGINKPTIENTENQDKTIDNCFVMLENTAPSVKVILPNTDSSTRNDGQIWYRKHTNAEDGSDAEKYIEVIVQDQDSGIGQIEMYVTKGDTRIPISADMEKNGTALLNYETTGKTNYPDRKNLCKEYHFYYSTESVAAKFAENDKDGKFEIEIKAIDNAGNVNAAPVDSLGNLYEDSKVVYYRDSVNPIVSQFILDPASFDNISEVNKDDFIQKLEYGYYFKKSFDVMIMSEDPSPSSNLDTAVFRLIPYENGEEKEAITPDAVDIVDGVAKYTIPAGFKGQIYGKVYDKVNNVSEERTPQGFVIDETAPTITIEPLPTEGQGKDSNGNKLFTGTVQFKVTISDNQSGLRSISFEKSSELDSHDAVATAIGNDAGYSEGTLDGWTIDKKDVNLITEVSRVFTFETDDNDISLTFNAMDRSGNASEPQTSEKFTIDTIAPQIAIVNNSTLINDRYYQGSTAFTITVTERNFSQDLMISKITNGFTSAIPTISFSGDANSSTHVATVQFPEGDYEFSFSGSDLGGHRASITVNGGSASEYFFETFNVDATSPVIKTNFSEFGEDEDKDIYFNKDQTAEITVTEHNFFDGDMGISVVKKSSGTEHISGGDGWYSIGYTSDWKEDGDKHTLSIKFDEDGVYRISISPKDRAENAGVFEEGSPNHTAVYEIDKTMPVYYARNNEFATDKNFKATPFYDVYDEKRKDEPAPTVEFDDINFDRIEVDTVVYTPTYKNGMELGGIEMSPVANELNKPVESKKFTLSNFDKDGVYALTFVAVDKAGNRSEPINNTYFRMVDTDVLAYIYNSNIADKTGYYSLMGEDGKALSKKAADFKDIDILVIKPNDNNESGRLILREDEKQYSPEEYSGYTIENEEVSETGTLMKLHLPGAYFSETFKDDGLNTRMYLSVSIRDDVYLDMASIHIDNEAPTATIPEEFSNWSNFMFVDEKTITFTNVSEKLNDELSKVYECPRNGERVEIPHTYDAESGTYSFTLSKGLHHIDVTLVDEAGNEWNIDRVKYLRVGNFRLYLGGGIGIAVIAAAIFFFLKKRKR